MKIEWNRVTWYSKLIAIVVFGITFFIAFKLGTIDGSATQTIIDSAIFASSTQNNSAAATPGCANATTQMDINDCEYQAYIASDQQLATLYQSLLSAIGPDHQTQQDFVSSEQKWTSYRDAACQTEADTESGGSLELATQDACLQAITQQRIDYLKSISNEFGVGV